MPTLLEERDDVALYRIEFDGLDVAILVIDGEEYSTTDWQGEQPTTIDETWDYDWMRLEDWQYT